MRTLKFCRIFLISTLFYFVSPIIILFIVLPNFLFRKLVQAAKKILRKDLNNIVSPLSNLFGVDKLYSIPTSTLILGSVYEGIISRDFVGEIIFEKWLEKRDPNGNLCYPELRQGLVSWNGYTFWRNDPAFNIFNHVKILDMKGSYFNRENMNELFVKMINEPFKELRSPWEILIIPHYVDSSVTPTSNNRDLTLVLFKVHHTLLDGFSMLNLGQRDLGNVTCAESQNKSDQQDFSFIFKCAAILRIPYFAAKHFVNENPLVLNGSSDITHSDFPVTRRQQVSFFLIKQVNLNKVKHIKHKNSVSLTSIFLAGYTAAIRCCLIKRMGLQAKNCRPSCMLPVPLPKHPEKLGNHMSFVSVKLPIYEPDSYRRLKYIHKTLERVQKSLDPLSMYYALTFVGSLPSFGVKLFLQKSPVPFLLSNFPGLSLSLSISGHRCTELFFNGGLLQGKIQMVCSSVGYNDVVELTVSVGGDNLILSRADIEEFMLEMMKEFNFLAS